jgi:hypothetical protein
VKTVLLNYPLIVPSAYGSRFYLDTVGESAEEATKRATITEVDSKGTVVSVCHVTECPSEIADVAIAEIKRLFQE